MTQHKAATGGELPSGSDLAKTPSLFVLVATNAAVIAVAVVQQWSLPTLLWTYWLQSVIIGAFQTRKILDLQAFSTVGFTMNDQPVLPNAQTKIRVASFFTLHYGFFHAIYAVFLWSIPGAGVEWTFVALSGLAFFLNHLLSYFLNRSRDQQRTPNIGTLMFFPYVRIIPMHLILLSGLLFIHSTVALAVFLVLKTLADALMHVQEHVPPLPSNRT